MNAERIERYRGMTHEERMRKFRELRSQLKEEMVKLNQFTQDLEKTKT